MIEAAQAAEQVKARIWPTRRTTTTTGAVRQPRMNPVAQTFPDQPEIRSRKSFRRAAERQEQPVQPVAGE